MIGADWTKFHGPYRESVDEIQAQVSYLLSTDDPSDDVELFLYNDLAANIRHQSRVFDVVMPVMDAIDDHLGRGNTRYRSEILFFLDSIFSEQIRDRCQILSTPVEYGYCARRLAELLPEEDKYFRRFRRLYLERYSHDDPSVDVGMQIYYDSVFGKVNAGRIRDGISTGDQRTVNCALIAHGFLRYHSLVDGTVDEVNRASVENPYLDIGLAMNHCDFDERRLRELLEGDEEVDVYWGGRYVSVLAACAYLIASSRRDLRDQMIAIDDVLQAYQHLKDGYAAEYDIDFPAHKYLLEDVSSIVYREHLGRGVPVGRSDMNEVQRHLYRALSEDLAVHTYSMLAAGVLPRGLSREDVESVYDIHECYQR